MATEITKTEKFEVLEIGRDYVWIKTPHDVVKLQKGDTVSYTYHVTVD